MIEVDELPARTAHVTHALIAAGSPRAGGSTGPLTAAEVCIFDAPWEALTPRHTGAALREAARVGLAAHAGPYWFPTGYAHELATELEERYLDDERAAGYG